MAGNSDRECTWLVNGIAVNPDGPVKPGCNTPAIGSLREIADEVRLRREYVAERSVWRWRVDGVGVNPAGRVERAPSDAEEYRDFGSLEHLVAERDRLAGENAGLRKRYAELVDAHNKCAFERDKLGEELSKEMAARFLQPLAAPLRPLTVGNALIQPTSLRVELPGGAVITIPQPKDQP